MKRIFAFLLFALMTVPFYAQGFAIQGIARDLTDAAITNNAMTFTFTVAKSDGTAIYQETQSIKTDNFGVYSHIIGTGTKTSTAAFADVDFSPRNLKLIIKVNYNGDVEIYNKPFQYTAYAKYADNGVPIGTVVSFLGTTAPAGWLLCDGQTDISTDAKYANLRAVLGTGITKVPDLRGMFIRGAGSGNTAISYDAVTLNTVQKDTIQSHNHDATGLLIADESAHTHNYWDVFFSESKSTIFTDYYDYNSGKLPGVSGYTDQNNYGWQVERTTKSTGAHFHGITGKTADKGGTETRPNNYGVNYIIKF